MDFLFQYGLFLAQAVTIVVSILAVVVVTIAVSSKSKPHHGEIDIEDISEYLIELKQHFEEKLFSKETLKQRHKAEKKAAKQQDKDQDQKDDAKPRLFVVDFKGSIDANEVNALRQEITAILTVASKDDEVLVKVDSGGGAVHGYGLAASQVRRIKEAGVNLTIAVDKVAASGGYMMACVADKILAAPFAIVGSIGVMAQLPNFNRLLKKHDVDFELFTAGDYKRTVTMFGENNDKGREKFKLELEETHVLFKQFVVEHRPSLDIDKVATGEHWYGIDALKNGLIDEISTSDDYLLKKIDSHKIYGVKCNIKKGMAEKFGFSLSIALDKVLIGWWQRFNQDRL